MNPRYFQEFLGERAGPPKSDRSRRGGLKGPCSLAAEHDMEDPEDD